MLVALPFLVISLLSFSGCGGRGSGGTSSGSTGDETRVQSHDYGDGSTFGGSGRPNQGGGSNDATGSSGGRK